MCVMWAAQWLTWLSLLCFVGLGWVGQGIVVAVGPGARHPQTGAVVPVAVKTGDSVLLPEYGGTNIVLGKGPEDELVMYREGDLLGTFAK